MLYLESTKLYSLVISLYCVVITTRNISASLLNTLKPDTQFSTRTIKNGTYFISVLVS